MNRKKKSGFPFTPIALFVLCALAFFTLLDAGAGSFKGKVRDVSAEESQVTPSVYHLLLFETDAGGQDGAVCDENGDCISDHCQNGYCCQSGDCCQTPGDCSGYGSPSVCDITLTCQGHREDAVCTAYVCDSVEVADDSGCDVSVEADDCGYYSSVYCNGLPEQSAPVCSVSCASDSDCDSNAHCDGEVCVAD